MQDVTLFGKRLPRTRAWGLGALVVIVLGFLLFQGMRYLDARGEVADLERQASQLASVVGPDASDDPAKAARLAAEDRRLEQARSLFDVGGSDTLLDLVASAAEKARISLMSVNIGDPEPLVLDSVQYETVPLVLTVQGDAASLDRYLGLLRQQSPVMQVTGLRVTGAAQLPLTRVQIRFYSSPAPVKKPVRQPVAASDANGQ